MMRIIVLWILIELNAPFWVFLIWGLSLAWRFIEELFNN